jgi:hypothetical protein
MNRKRNGFEYNNHEENRYGPMTKKIRSPLSPSFDKLHLNNKIDENILLSGQNGSIKSMIISNLSPQVLQIILKKKIFLRQTVPISKIITIAFVLCNLISCFLFCLYENSRHQAYVIVENDDLGLHKKCMGAIHQQILRCLLQQLVQIVKHEKDLIYPVSVSYFSNEKKTNKSSILSFDKIVRVFSIVIEKVFYKY